MKKFLFVPLLVSLFLFSLPVSAQNDDIHVIDKKKLQELLNKPKKITLMNFWATWCKPCIKELPYFQAAEKKYPQIDFMYMNLDFVEQVEKVKRFADKKGIDRRSIYLIDNVDYNSWIDLVSADWSGAIPATLLIIEGKKFFYEKEFHEGELEKLLQTKL